MNMAAKFIAFAFKTQKDRADALEAVAEKYHKLQTNIAEQILDNGFQYILFLEDCSSFTFNLTLAALVKEFGGVPRDTVRI